MRLKDILQETPPDKMTPELWDTLQRIDKMRWRKFWKDKGVEYFRCNVCKYPTAMGVSGCDYCKYRKDNRVPLVPAR